MSAWAVLCVYRCMETAAAQEACFRAHYPALAGWAGALTGDRDVGLEVASDAFVRLLGAWPRVQDPRAFLYTAAANLVRDRWRRDQSRRRAWPFIQQSSRASAPATDPSLRDLVDRLPPRTRVPVLLHYCADLSAEDIARQLGQSAPTVRRLLAEARDLLRVALEESPA